MKGREGARPRNAKEIASGLDLIVVAGFGPFQCHLRNPSSEIAAALPAQAPAGVRFASTQLETSWQRAWPQILSTVGEQRPLALILLGACLDPFFRLEMIARNHWSPEPDIDGLSAPPGTGHSLIEDGPEYYLSTLPFERLQRGLGSSVLGIPVKISSDAGAFICNQVYYLARHVLGTTISNIGFVHVPPLQLAHLKSTWTDALIIDAGIALMLELTHHLRESDGASTATRWF